MTFFFELSFIENSENSEKSDILKYFEVSNRPSDKAVCVVRILCGMWYGLFLQQMTGCPPFLKFERHNSQSVE